MDTAAFAARLEYWCFPALLALLLATVKFRWPSRAALGGALLAAVLTFTVLAGLKSAPWVQWDETTILANSVGMHYLRQNAFVTQTNLDLTGPLLLTQDHRPPFFAFALSLAHDFFGVRAANALLVNSLALWALLLLTFLAVHRRLGSLPAVAALLFLLSSPILLWCASSGGSDLFALCWLVAFAAAAAEFARAPSARASLLLVITGALFAYTRFEAIGLFAVGAAAALFLARRRLTAPALRPFALVPLLLAPLLVFLLLGRLHSYELYERAVRGVYGADPTSLRYVLPNAGIFLRAFFDPRGSLYAGALHCVGIAAFAYALYRGQARGPLIWVAGLLAAGSCALLFGLVFGRATSLESLRLFLPAIFVGALAPLLWARLFPGRRTEIALLILGLVLFRHRYPFAQTERGLYTSIEGKGMAALPGALARAPFELAHALFVFDTPRYFVMGGLYAVTPDYFREHENLAKDWLRAGRIAHVYFVDIYSPDMTSPLKDLAARYSTRTAMEWNEEGASGRILELSAFSPGQEVKK